MSEFKVNIITKADLSGARNTALALARLEREADKATKRYSAGLDKANRGTGRLREQLGALGSQMPILGRIGSLALNPLTLAIGGAIALFTTLKRKIDEFSAALQTTPWESVQGSAERQADVTRKMAEQTAEYKRSIEELLTAQTTLEQATARANAQLTQQVAATRKVNAAVKERELSKVAALEAKGALTPDQATARRQKIERGFSRQDRALTEAERQGREHILRQQYYGSHVRRGQAERDIAQLEPQHFAAQDDLKRAEQAAAADQARLAAAEKDLAQLDHKLEGGVAGGKGQTLRIQRGQLVAVRDAARKKAAQSKDALTQKRIHAADIQARYQGAQQRKVASFQTELSSRTSLQDMGAKHRLERRTEATVAGVQDQTQLYHALEQGYQSQKAANDQIVALVERNVQVSQQTVQKAARLEQQVAELERRAAVQHTRSRGQLNP